MKAPLELAVVNVDFRVAPTAWRATLALSDDDRAELERSLVAHGASAFVTLNTCNRTTWIVAGGPPRWMVELLKAEIAERWLRSAVTRGAEPLDRERHAGLGAAKPSLPVPESHVGFAAAHHLLRVAAGLESLVMGEQQIGVQLKGALEDARSRGPLPPVLNRLANSVGRVHKKLRKHTDVLTRGKGVHTLAREVVHRALAEAGSATSANKGSRPLRIAVVGLGAIGKQVETTLHRAGDDVVVVNRTVRAPHVQPMDALGSVLAEADAAIVCTGAGAPVLTAAHLAERDPARAPLVLVDVGSPAQVAANVQDAGCVLFDIDALVRAGVRPTASSALRAAETIVNAEDAAFRHHTARHRARAVVEPTQALLKETLRARLPAVLAAHAPTLSEAEQTALAQRLRPLFEDLTAAVRDAVVHLDPQLLSDLPATSPVLARIETPPGGMHHAATATDAEQAPLPQPTAAPAAAHPEGPS